MLFYSYFKTLVGKEVRGVAGIWPIWRVIMADQLLAAEYFPAACDVCFCFLSTHALPPPPS